MEAQPVGYFSEASILFPQKLHEAQNDDPLAADTLNVEVKILIRNKVELRTQYKMSRSAHCTNLIPNLLPKSNFMVHYLSLRFYLEDMHACE